VLDDPHKTDTMRSILNFFDDEADVLIAADVAYDTALVPLLAKLVKRFLNMRGGREVIFATTLRNQSTFQLFQDQLKYHSINSKYEDTSVIDELPIVFPISFLQPRSDTRICGMFLDNIHDS
jgi:predicted nicotinamide N-methyase